MEAPSAAVDSERNDASDFLMNHSVHNFSWSGLTVTVKDRQTTKARDLINDISGEVQQGTYRDSIWCSIQPGSC